MLTYSGASSRTFLNWAYAVRLNLPRDDNSVLCQLQQIVISVPRIKDGVGQIAARNGQIAFFRKYIACIVLPLDVNARFLLQSLVDQLLVRSAGASGELCVRTFRVTLPSGDSFEASRPCRNRIRANGCQRCQGYRFLRLCLLDLFLFIYNDLPNPVFG